MNATTRLVPTANNLTLVRLVLASAVIWSHCVWLVTGSDMNDPTVMLFGQPTSDFAVDGFFFLSGFLVYNSLLRRGSPWDFARARLARLWPGLAVSVLVVTVAGYFIAGLPLDQYLRGDTTRFIVGNLSLTKGQYTLTGVAAAGKAVTINGSLWTIPWEVRCYVILFLAALLSLARPMRIVPLLLLPSLIFALLFHLPPIQHWAGQHLSPGIVYNLTIFDRLWTMFALGTAALVVWPYLRLSWSVAIAGVVVLALSVQYFPIPHLVSLVTGYCVLCAGFLTGTGSARWPDYSYGMYIYAFPAMMAVHALFPTHSAVLLALLTACATLPLAMLSWHFVEHPVLELVRNRRRPAPGLQVAPAIEPGQ
ncbi:acyltransferase family protein [Sphingomonas lycopersici]|uniref:Acyltransferase n=1 Tax=Sphingomonas lycopersici TaxID=2951807 RepID=A0AA41ZC09_9SPHN|nr:acyltransferase [Sphingomonas lycopersici]MCW6536562.1 acyltransferase [Sphingomonas lycopersici]